MPLNEALSDQAISDSKDEDRIMGVHDALLTGILGILGAYLYQLQRYLWADGDLPGRGRMLWFLLLLALGIAWHLSRGFSRWIAWGQMLLLGGVVGSHALLQRDLLGAMAFDAATLLSLWWAGAALSVPCRAMLHLDIRDDLTVGFGRFLGGLFLIFAIMALLPYFGALPVAALLMSLLAFHLWQAQAPTQAPTQASTPTPAQMPTPAQGWSERIALLLVLAGVWSAVPWSSGIFLSRSGRFPVERRVIEGKVMRLERDQRVKLYEAVGEGEAFFSAQQMRFAEPMIAPWLEGLGAKARILLLGAEDGMLTRILLQEERVASVELWTPHRARMQFFATQPILRRLHGDAFSDRRVVVHTQPSYGALQSALLKTPLGAYDAILQALPSAEESAMSGFYDAAWFRALAKRLRPHGRIVIAAGSWQARQAVACVGHALHQAGLSAFPYRFSGLEQTWIFWMASPQKLDPTSLRLPAGLRVLHQDLWPAMLHFPDALDPRRIRPDACLNEAATSLPSSQPQE